MFVFDFWLRKSDKHDKIQMNVTDKNAYYK